MKAKIAAAKGPDRLILVAGLVFVIASFLPWYGVRLPVLGLNASVSGWNSGGLAVFSILLAIACTALALVRVLGMDVSFGSVNDGIVYLALGGGAGAFALLRLLTQARFTQYGLYVSIVAGAALALGGWQKFSAAKG